MAKKQKLKFIQIDVAPVGDAWEITTEFVAEEDMVILGFMFGCISRGLAGAISIQKSGTAPKVPIDAVLVYFEIAGGVGTILENRAMFWFPKDFRYELDEDERLYFWVESGNTNLQNCTMYYHEVA